jgi:hypothetical protein
MNSFKLLFGVSVAANIAFGVAFVRNQRKERERVLAEIARIRQEIAFNEELDKAMKVAEDVLDAAREGRKKREASEEDFRLNMLRSTAFLDQHDAWVEENFGNVK